MKEKKKVGSFFTVLFYVLCEIAASILLVFAMYPVMVGAENAGAFLAGFCSILLAIFPLLHWQTKKSGNKKAHRIVNLIYGIGLAVFLFFSALMIRCAYFIEPPSTGNYTVIVLGSYAPDESPSTVLRNRLDVAYDYLVSNPEADCIVSGGKGKDEQYPEAEVMFHYLVNRGIDPQRIQQENQSVNTRTNLRYSKKLIPAESKGIIIITDNFHQMRASVTAKSLGLTPLYHLSSFPPLGLLPSYWLRDLPGIPLTWIEELFRND